MRAMSVAELKYQAILAVIGGGRTISEVAAQWRGSRRTLHRWLVRYGLEGLGGLSERQHRPGADRYRRPLSCLCRWQAHAPRADPGCLRGLQGGPAQLWGARAGAD